MLERHTLKPYPAGQLPVFVDGIADEETFERDPTPHSLLNRLCYVSQGFTALYPPAHQPPVLRFKSPGALLP